MNKIKKSQAIRNSVASASKTSNPNVDKLKRVTVLSREEIDNSPENLRETIFISKATPGDDEFVLWLAPKLQAAGYRVYADILDLVAGDGWRRKITDMLQKKSIKMLLCCTDETLQKDGVVEEIEIALEIAKELNDPNFIIPIKLKHFRKFFGIGSLQYIDFENRWANGLKELLTSLERQNVPKVLGEKINQNWAAYQRRESIRLRDEPEVLTSNWLRIQSVPDDIYMLAPTGSCEGDAIHKLADAFTFPNVTHERGLFTFASPSDLEEEFPSMGRFDVLAKVPLISFMEEGSEDLDIQVRDARNMVVSLFRQAWEKHLTKNSFFSRSCATGMAHHVSDEQIGLNKRVSWGRQGKKRLSVLRNKARGKIWSYGVSAQPSLYPWPHFRMKARVHFSEVGKDSLNLDDDKKYQHRLRRSICSKWRNKAWHGRMMAFLELLAGDSPYINLPVGDGQSITVDAMPVQVTSKKTARQINNLDEDAEETDFTTLAGIPVLDEDEEIDDATSETNSMDKGDGND